MKSIATLVFVLAFIGLAQSALLSFLRLRPQPKKQETFAVPVTRSFPLLRTQDIRKHFLETITKAKWYQKGLWFVNKVLKEMTKNGGRDEFVKLYKKTTLAPLLKDKLRF